jgi:hypothetical protein
MEAEGYAIAPAVLGAHSAGAPHIRQNGCTSMLAAVPTWRGPGWLDPVTARSIAAAGATRGFWADCDWWYGRDEKYRPIGPGLQPLAHGAPARVVRLRGYGDAIGTNVLQRGRWDGTGTR